MKTYFVTMWKMNWSLLTEYWYVYLILTLVLTVLVLKFEKEIMNFIVKVEDKIHNFLNDYKKHLESC